MCCPGRKARNMWRGAIGAPSMAESEEQERGGKQNNGATSHQGMLHPMNGGQHLKSPSSSPAGFLETHPDSIRRFWSRAQAYTLSVPIQPYKRPRGIKAARPNPRDRRLELHAERLIAEHELIPRDAALVVGVSGGPDSVSLLDFLVGHRARSGAPTEIVAGHVNHGLRGAESEEDQAFVEALAVKLEVRFMTAKVDPAARRDERGESLEESARKLRYGALRRMAAAAR